MSNINLGKNMASLNVGRQLASYTGVIIHTGMSANGTEISYSSGNSSGYVLEIENPLGTQVMADAILAGLRLRNTKYQPFEADQALLDPAAEIGDNVTANGTTAIIANRNSRYTAMMDSDISAPYDEEVNSAFKYEPKAVRDFKRESAYARSRISQTEGQITLEVVRATNAENYLGSRITISESSILATVSGTYETKTDATSKLNQAKGYTDGREAIITASYTSAIKQSADSIKLTVAGAESKYDETGVTINYRGFGTPSDFYTASGNTNKIYLNQEDGRYYKSNGTQWVQQGTLTLITDNLSSQITQTASSITSTIAGSTSKYDTTGLTVDLYGYGGPTAAGYPAADNNGKYYLNQSNGYFYLSDGSTWVFQSARPLITDNLKTSIDQRLDHITLSVSSTSGSSSFTISDNGTTIATQTLDLSVKAVNVSGTLTASQIDATNLHVSAANIDGTLTASQIKVGMNDNLYDTYDSFEQVTNTTIYPRVGANADTGKSTNATLTAIDSQFAKDGAKVLSFAVASGGTEAWSYIGYNYKDSAYLNAAYWRGFPRLSAGDYIASCYVIRANGGSNAVAKLRVLGTKVRSSAYLDSGNATIYDTKTVTLGNALTWPETQRIEVPFTVTSTYPFAFLQLRVAPADSSAVTCYFDCLQIEKVDSGQSAGAWKPASTTTISGNSITTGTLNADLITTGTLNATNVNVTNINGQNIRTGSIFGGEYGAIGSGEITTWNTTSGINTNLGYGASYGSAISSSSADGATYFNAGYIRARNSLTCAGYGFTRETVTVRNSAGTGTVTLNYWSWGS